MATTEEIERALLSGKPLRASTEERKSLAQLVKVLAHATLKVVESGVQSPVPKVVEQLVRLVSELLAQGEAVLVSKLNPSLTTGQAAEILNVSRQYLVRLLDEKEIPSYKTGTHRRIELRDVLAYKARRDKERHDALNKLSALSQEYGELDDYFGKK